MEVGIDLLIVCFVFGAIVSKWRKWYFIATVFPIFLVLISILGGRTESTQVTSSGVKSDQSQQEAIQRKAPTVTFVDGQKAVVGFSVTSHIEEEDAALVVVTCGSADNARDSLDPKVVSSVIAELETRTLLQARQDRQKIEQNLIERLSPQFKKVGLTLDHISLLEFRENQ